MPSVSKGSLRIYKMKSAKLSLAVPTLDLRRKQLTKEMLQWEERIRELERRRNDVAAKMGQCPHPEVDRLVSIGEVKTSQRNIAGVLLDEVSGVGFNVAPMSFFASAPSLDVFIDIKKGLIEVDATLVIMKRSLAVLLDELAVTTQRINLFEKRLIPEYDEQIRYIRGRLEDLERSNVMVAKIAQKEILQQAHTSETA